MATTQAPDRLGDADSRHERIQPPSDERSAQAISERGDRAIAGEHPAGSSRQPHRVEVAVDALAGKLDVGGLEPVRPTGGGHGGTLAAPHVVTRRSTPPGDATEAPYWRVIAPISCWHSAAVLASHGSQIDACTRPTAQDSLRIVPGPFQTGRRTNVRALLAAIAALLVLAAVPAAANANPVATASAVCADYANQAAAQQAADTIGADGDGIYCESLPCATGGGDGTCSRTSGRLG